MQFQFQQLRRAANAAERVLDFMGQIADQLLVGLTLVEQPFLTVQFQLLHVLAQLDQHRHRRIVQRGDDAIDLQGLAPDPLQRHILPLVIELVRQRLLH